VCGRPPAVEKPSLGKDESSGTDRTQAANFSGLLAQPSQQPRLRLASPDTYATDHKKRVDIARKSVPRCCRHQLQAGGCARNPEVSVSRDQHRFIWNGALSASFLQPEIGAAKDFHGAGDFERLSRWRRQHNNLPFGSDSAQNLPFIGFLSHAKNLRLAEKLVKQNQSWPKVRLDCP